MLAQFIVVTPAELEFTHRVGGDDCPQLIGRIRIRNADTVRRTPVIVADSHLGFRQGSGLVNGVEVAIEPNQTIEIDCISTAAGERASHRPSL